MFGEVKMLDITATIVTCNLFSNCIVDAGTIKTLEKLEKATADNSLQGYLSHFRTVCLLVSCGYAKCR